MHDMIKNIFKEYTLEIFVLQYINYFKSKLNQRILSIKYVSILGGLLHTILHELGHE